jgi:hypothetical protein
MKLSELPMKLKNLILFWAKWSRIDLDRQLADEHSVVVTSEEGSIVRFSDHVLHFLAPDSLLDAGEFKFQRMVIPVT